MAQLHRKVLARLGQPVTNNKGIAILIAVACIMVITYFAMEITYDSNVEYIVNSQGLSRLKAYYAAKAGMDISLLRIKIFQKASAQYGKQLGSSASMLDMIWQMPFSWPMPVPDNLDAADKDSVKKMMKESSMDASYIVSIQDEGSRIDLNDLNSMSQSLQDNARMQLLQLFENRKKNDDEFQRKYSSTRFDELVDNIQGWMSSKSRTAGGQDKHQGYSELNSKVGQDYFPPNRNLISLAELHLIPGMNDDFYAMLEPVVTIYGMKGINPNIATKEVLKSLDFSITDAIADELIKRRGDTNLGGPYKDAKDFWDYATSKGAHPEGDTSKIPLTFDNIVNFRIQSIGNYASVTREIDAVVLDFAKTAGLIKSAMSKNTSAAGGNGGNNQGANQGNNSSSNSASDGSAKGPPRVVYWNEK